MTPSIFTVYKVTSLKTCLYIIAWDSEWMSYDSQSCHGVVLCLIGNIVMVWYILLLLCLIGFSKHQNAGKKCRIPKDENAAVPELHSCVFQPTSSTDYETLSVLCNHS